MAEDASYGLAQEELDACRDAFLLFDKDRSGSIDLWELKLVLEAMGQKPSDEEVFEMIALVDDNQSGAIEFGEFIRVVTNNKMRRAQNSDETDMIDAFIACGGQPDKSGCVERATLVRIIKVDFGLTIDIEELIDAVDTDGSGEIEYGEFKDLLSKS